MFGRSWGALALTLTAITAHAASVDDVVQKAREAQVAEAEARIAQAKERSMASAAKLIPQSAPIAKKEVDPPVEDIRLVAVYGLKDLLYADFVLNGAVISLQRGQSIAGWKVVEVDQIKAVVARANGRERRELYITPPVSDLGGITGPSGATPIPVGSPIPVGMDPARRSMPAAR